MRRFGIFSFGFALISFVHTTSYAQTFTRVVGTGDVPSGRTTPAVGSLGTQVYLFGGLLDDFASFTNTFYDDTYRFDTTTGAWTRLSPATSPPARTFAAAAGHEGRGVLAVFGGSVYDPTFQVFSVFDDLWVYAPGDNTWTEIVASNAGPDARSGASMWADGDKLYVFGGITQFFQFRNDLWSYDFGTNLWTLHSPDGAAGAPPGRHVASAGQTLKQGKLTLYGGEALDFTTFDFVILEDVWQYDVAAQQWIDATPAPAKDLPLHRNYGAAARIGQRLFIHGGDIPGGTTGCNAPFLQNVSNEIWSFHLVQKRWRRHDAAGAVRLKRSASAVVDGKMYIFSGWDFVCPGGVGPGQVFNTDVFVYDND
ncbi:MAG: kelch repeat-containing protein [Deltaproteobacteria bacterium]|jgi:N-acetylneuraminic acid mutarotase